MIQGQGRAFLCVGRPRRREHIFAGWFKVRFEVIVQPLLTLSRGRYALYMNHYRTKFNMDAARQTWAPLPLPTCETLVFQRSHLHAKDTGTGHSDCAKARKTHGKCGVAIEHIHAQTRRSVHYRVGAVARRELRCELLRELLRRGPGAGCAGRSGQRGQGTTCPFRPNGTQRHRLCTER